MDQAAAVPASPTRSSPPIGSPPTVSLTGEVRRMGDASAECIGLHIAVRDVSWFYIIHRPAPKPTGLLWRLKKGRW